MPVDWDGLVLAPLEGVFGEPATYQRAAGGAPFAVTGVFDRAYLDQTMLDDGSSANAVRPVLGVRLAQFAAPPVQNDTVHITSVNLTYVVRDVRGDGHGFAKLMLNLAAGQ